MIQRDLELKQAAKRRPNIRGLLRVCAREKIKLACITSTAAEESEREKCTAALKLKSFVQSVPIQVRNV
jgi:hypothetical protein